jgi:glycosyltransferase involved in cell wall biosynthesis
MRVREIIADTEWHPSKDYGSAKPLVSVLLPTFRRGESGLFLKAVRSVLSQSLVDLELIIVDDGSTDGTAGQISQMMAEDERVSCLRHPRNVGLPAISEYEAFLKARAQYLAFAFDDDEFYPNAIQGLFNYAQKNDSPIIHGYVDMYVYDGATQERGKISEFGRGSTPQILLASTNYISNNSVLLHRRLVEKVGLYDPHVAISRLCDWDLWRRIAAYFDIVAVDVPVGQVHGPSTADSLGHTYTMDLWQAFEWMNVPRNEQLLPEKFEDYDIFSIPESLSGETKLAIQEIRENFKSKFWYPKTLPKLRRVGSEGAVRGSKEDGHILVVTGIHDACTSLYFDHLPLFYHQRVRIVMPGYWLPEEMIGATCVIFVRNLPDFAEWIEYARKLQIPHYYFLDDNLMLLGKETRYQSTFGSFTEEWVREMLQSFSGVLLSTGALTDYFRENKIHGHLFYYPPIAKRVGMGEKVKCGPSDEGSLRIAFFGGSHRNEPFKEVVFPAIRQFAQHHRVELFVGGLKENSLQATDRLRITYFSFDISYDRALERFAVCGIDVLVHPNSQTSNNTYKSLNVLINAMTMDAVPILSNEAPYDRLSGENVALLCSQDEKSWVEAIELVYHEPETAKAIRRNVEKFCEKEYDGAANVEVLSRILLEKASPGLVLRDMRFRTLIRMLRHHASRQDHPSAVENSLGSSLVVPFGPPGSCLHLVDKIKYVLIPSRHHWTGLDVLVGTHQRVADGVLRMRILSSTGHLLREVAVDLVHARDNDWLSFRFPPIANSSSMTFVIEFALKNARPQTALSLYEKNSREGTARRLARRAGIRLPGNELFCRFWHDT